MSRISETDAYQLFERCKTTLQLKECIKQNCHLWFDEDSTLNSLENCYVGAKKMKRPAGFGTMLISETGDLFQVVFIVNPDGTCCIRG